VATDALKFDEALKSVEDLGVFKELLDGGRIEVDAADDDGVTLLHAAIDRCREDVARLLVNAGAAVNRQDRWGNTPLWRAIYHAPGAASIIELLLERGADPTVKNNHDTSPIELAHRTAGDHEELARLLPALDAAADKFRHTNQSA
jgi:ankyrin repeat protein